MAAVSNMAAWLVIIKGKRNNPDNKNLKPGRADVCITRGEKIVEMETEQKNFEGDIREIKGDIREIKRAVVVK